MSGKNLFDEPFDDGTKAKLEIFKQYFEEWLPVFVAGKAVYWKDVQVFDFFAGMGKDKSGYKGSPLIVLDAVKSLESHITRNKINLRLLFNEKRRETYEELVTNINDNCGFSKPEICNKEFQKAFEENYASMNSAANFLFLDQNGIKEITSEIFEKIIKLKKTDFIFFISSSFFKRFAKTPEFKRYFPSITEDIDSTHYYHIHRKVLEHYKSLIPSNKEYYLAPFSIKKGTNIYGLIFGTNHTLGIEKFLNVAWKFDKLRGEANYDIDQDQISNIAPKLFAELNTPNKRQVFEKNLTAKIIEGKLQTNKAVYLATLTDGFLLKDANSILKKLKTERKITFDFNLITANLHKQKEELIKLV